MSRFVIIILSVLVSIQNLSSEETYRIPDFAFPLKVESQSDSLLSVSLETGQQTLALRAALNLIVARSLTEDEESLRENISLIDSIIPRLSYPYRSLASLIEAEILQQEYTSESNVYDARNLPLDEPYPLDPKEWSGAMLKNRIYELVDSAAIVSSDRLASTANNEEGVEKIALLLTDTKEAERIRLTIQEFIAFKSVALLKSYAVSSGYTLIPFFPEQEKTTLESKCDSLAKSLLKNLCQSDNPVVRALAMRDYLFFLPDGERENYLYESLKLLKGTEGEGLLLYELWNRYGKVAESRYSDIITWLGKFPDGFGNALLRYALSELNRERIEVEFPKVSLPNEPIKGNVSVSNLEKSYLLIYKLNENQTTAYDELILKKFNPSTRPIHIVETGESGVIPYQYTKDVTIPELGEGLYVVIPSKSTSLPKGFNKASSNSNYATIRVSGISLLTTCDYNAKESGKVYVVNAHNQQPISNAMVAYYKGGDRKLVKKLVTNSEGWVSVPTGYYRIEATYGKSVAKTEAGFNYTPVNNAVQYHTTILTDLAVYHPGDTVRYAVVGWKQDNSGNSLVKDSKLEVSLRDANYITVASDTVTLIQEGRATGFFVIPKGRLLGTYSLNAGYPDKKGQGGGSANILVEEYKLPAFLVTIDKADSIMPDVVSFKGEATTYSGMPVADATVNIKVEFLPWRWGFPATNASYHESLSTGPDGRFEITLPLSGLKGTIFEKGRYSITAEVTSPAGESEKSAPLYFYLGEACDIRPSIPEKIEKQGNEMTLHVPVYDMAGMPIQTEVEYRFTNLFDSSETLRGNFESPLLSIPTDSIPSGMYRIEFRVSANQEWTTTEAIFWSPRDMRAPYPVPLWLPVTNYYYTAEQKEVDVTFGSYYEDWMLCIVSDGENVIDSKWIEPSDSLINMKVTIPEGNPTLFITLMGMHDFVSANGVIKIEPAKNLEKLSIETISFRPNISAGDQEDWIFRFKVGEKSASFVNAFAVLSDKALNSIYDFKWNLNLWKRDVYPKVRITAKYSGNAFSYKTFTPISRYPAFNIDVIPSWQTYNYPLVSSGGIRFGGPIMYKAMATRNVMNDLVETGAMKEEAEDSVSMEESAVAGDTLQENAEELRPVEMPLAFFRPDLQADENGEMQLKFTVPNFNTTWQLQVAGYNDELLGATLLLDAVASKPVMVKSNLPQYLRTGDKAEISATLYNNSDNWMSIGGRLEVEDIISGQILVSREFEGMELSPSGSRVVSLQFDVPDNVSAIAVRAWASGEKYSDGEQGFVAILPSSTPVVESTVFYAKSDEEKIEVKLPRYPKDANITLKYFDNPLWEVLLSLPTLNEDNSGGALSLSRSLYSALTSMDIINTNQGISQGLHRILNSQDSSLTVSALQKDEYLKIAALEATPWLNDAYSETVRIRSLGQYFDTSEMEARISATTDALGRLQNADGGFSWFEGMKSSSYITSQVIGVLGYLKQRNLLRPELESMARKAVKYYDGYVGELFKKSQNFNALSIVDYLYSRNMLGFGMPSVLKKLERECCDSIVSNWRYRTPGQKAKWAMVLMDNGNYTNEVNIITASIKEFLNSRLTLDEEALILELLVRKGGEGEAIEKVREKMFLQKETTEWSRMANATGIIYALLNSTDSSMSLLSEPRSPEIFIDGKQIEAVANPLSEITVSLSAKEVSGKKLVIKRSPGVPAWGGIISQYVKPIRDVKSVGSENISIEKRVFMEDPKGNVKEVKEFHKGDKVTVVLNLTCKKDMDYVVIADSRAACLQPEDKVSGMVNVDGMNAYRELRYDKTSFFIEHLPAGKYVISYDCNVERSGSYSLGISEVQSLYSPGQTAHSSGTVLKVMPGE